MVFSGGSESKSICLQCRRPGLDPWIRKIPWRRKWQPNPVLLPGKSHGWRRLIGYSPWGHKESDTTEQLHFQFFTFCMYELEQWSCVINSCCCCCSFPKLCQLFATLLTVACQAPLSMEFSSQKCCSGLPFPSPGDLPDPGIKLASLASPGLAGRFFISAPPRKSRSIKLEHQ